MGHLRIFSTRVNIATAILAISFAHSALALGGGGPPPKGSQQVPDAGTQDTIPRQAMTAGSAVLAIKPVTIISFKRDEDEFFNIRFEVTPKDERPVTLTIPPEMLKTPDLLTKRGLPVRAQSNNLAGEPCYFDSDRRLLSVVVTDFPATQTRLYTITDLGYASRNPGTNPTVVFEVKIPDAPVPLIGKKTNSLGKVSCELHVTYFDGRAVRPNEPKYQASSDPESCEPWIKTSGSDAGVFPGVNYPFAFVPVTSDESVQNHDDDPIARPPI